MTNAIAEMKSEHWKDEMEYMYIDMYMYIDKR